MPALNRILGILCFLLAGSALMAEETFESEILTKEVQLVYGNGALSVESNIYSIMVMNKEEYMKIEVPKEAYDLLGVGDVVRITFDRGLLYNDIKSIALLKRAADRPN